MTIEALHAVDLLEKRGVSCDLIDLRTIKPIDWQLIFDSVRKTGRILALDTEWETGSVAGEIVARVAMSCFDSLKQAPRRLALPDYPTPTSPSLTKPFYKRAEDIVNTVSDMVGKDVGAVELNNQRDCPHDVPGNWFKGPF
jgi:pyruvate dehydrogenase E1 component beta subunit